MPRSFLTSNSSCSRRCRSRSSSATRFSRAASATDWTFFRTSVALSQQVYDLLSHAPVGFANYSFIRRKTALRLLSCRMPPGTPRLVRRVAAGGSGERRVVSVVVVDNLAAERVEDG